MTKKMDNTTRYERARERYMNGDLDRRSFLGLIGAAGLAYGVSTPFAKYAHAATTAPPFMHARMPSSPVRLTGRGKV